MTEDAIYREIYMYILKTGRIYEYVFGIICLKKISRWSIGTLKDAQHCYNQINTNQNHGEVSLHSSQNAYHQKEKK